MKLRLALAALLLASFTASAALNAYRSTINLSQAVKLPDGTILPPGPYELEIEYKGFGNAAQFHFFKGTTLLGTTPAEARGFPSQAPATVKPGAKVSVDDTKLQPAGAPQGTIRKWDPENPKNSENVQPAAPAAFDWKTAGFSGAPGKVAPAGQSVKISFDSSNSAAGFHAVLPSAPKGK